eukprot:545504-Rhodomonas_salina.1
MECRIDLPNMRSRTSYPPLMARWCHPLPVGTVAAPLILVGCVGNKMVSCKKTNSGPRDCKLETVAKGVSNWEAAEGDAPDSNPQLCGSKGASKSTAFGSEH